MDQASFAPEPAPVLDASNEVEMLKAQLAQEREARKKAKAESKAQMAQMMQQLMSSQIRASHNNDDRPF